MRGDVLVIEDKHRKAAKQAMEIIGPEIAKNQEGFAVSVAGESGAGKSEIASVLSDLLKEKGIKNVILQQDDYFVFPPKINHEMRRRNLEQVGPYEVKLDFLNSNLRSFKRGESPIYKPLVIFD